MGWNSVGSILESYAQYGIKSGQFILRHTKIAVPMFYTFRNSFITHLSHFIVLKSTGASFDPTLQVRSSIMPTAED